MNSTKRTPLSISIHALREEGDLALVVFRNSGVSISIHALRAEGDPPMLPTHCVTGDFYPRPPRGGRPGAAYGAALGSIFLSTPSARRAT